MATDINVCVTHLLPFAWDFVQSTSVTWKRKVNFQNEGLLLGYEKSNRVSHRGLGRDPRSSCKLEQFSVFD